MPSDAVQRKLRMG